MSYSVKFQTESAYKSIAYGQGTIYSSACGPSSLCNALAAADIADVSIPTMCKLAVSCGARVTGGTDLPPLLKAAGEKYNFSYATTSKNAELLSHLQAGGVAILHAGSEYKLFSNSGHFVAAVAASGQTITVLDSYWYSGKYTASAIRRNNVTVLQKGVIQTSLTQCGKATIDRSPSYYLISRKKTAASASTAAATVTTTIESEKETDDMTYYETINDVPSYYKTAVQKMIDKGALSGIGGGKLHVSEDMCRIFTVLDNAGMFK